MAKIRTHRLLRLPVIAALLAGLCGCAVLREFQPSVTVEPMAPGEYISLQRGDLLTTGALSAATTQTLRVAGLDMGVCATPSRDCIVALGEVQGVPEERRLSALAELWLQQAMSPSSAARAAQAPEDRLPPWLEAARFASAYLFFTPRTPGERAFEDRQTQVRDWYNYAVQQATAQMFEARAGRTAVPMNDDGSARLGHWNIHMELAGIRLPEGVEVPQELLPASSLSFQGLRSTYRRDGFGAELVAVMSNDPVTVAAAPAAPADAGAHDGHRGRAPRPPAWSEMPSPSLTVLFRFPGTTLDEVLQTRVLRVTVHDPYVESEITLHGQRVPLAANFTAGYGLWLARSGFNRQSLRTLFGRGQGIDRPHLYMMQPFDPDRRIILMLHGLASSPEAWVNVANEVLGDEALRKEFQVWQVYYPTNMPVALNHAAIRQLFGEALRHFDPDGQSVASRDVVLIGHSMGGMIARLMVSSSGRELWDWAMSERDIQPERLEPVRPQLEGILRFEPLPQVGRAIFIATPHRGTAVAGTRAGRWVSRLVRLPLTLLEGFGEVMQAFAEGGDDASGRPPNSIDNLSEQDGFVKTAAGLPISGRVRYHSIIARQLADGPLEDSDDGLVTYPSAHLAGAASERVIVSGHSVQESAPAILEVRRILLEDLEDERGRRP